MTDHHDSNHNDTNAGEEHPNTTPRAGHDGYDTGSNAGDDLDWAAFAASYLALVAVEPLLTIALVRGSHRLGQAGWARLCLDERLTQGA